MMARITIGIGLLLTGIGLAGYFPDKPSITALIPAFVGGVLVVLGLLALSDRLRKHSMHLAAMVGLLGFLGAAGSLLRKPLQGEELTLGKAALAQVGMAVVCLVFVALCVRSFIEARRSRAQKAAGE